MTTGNEYPLAEDSSLNSRSQESLESFFEKRREFWQIEEGNMTLENVASFVAAGLDHKKAHFNAVTKPGRLEIAKSHGPASEAFYWQTSDELLTEVEEWQMASKALKGEAPITEALHLFGRLEDEARQTWEAAIDDTSLAETWLRPNAMEAKTGNITHDYRRLSKGF